MIKLFLLPPHGSDMIMRIGLGGQKWGPKIKMVESDMIRRNTGKYSCWILKCFLKDDNKIERNLDIRNLLLQDVDFKQLGEIAYNITKN